MELDTFRFLIYISLPFIAATIWAILDASQKEFGSLNHKVAWMMVGAIPFLGFILYLIFGFKKGKKPGNS